MISYDGAHTLHYVSERTLSLACLSDPRELARPWGMSKPRVARPAKPVESDTRYCACCLRAIPRTTRAAVAWCNVPSSDPRPVLLCSAKCARIEARAQAESEAYRIDRDPGYYD